MKGMRWLLSLMIFAASFFGMLPSALADGEYPVRISQQNLIVFPVSPDTLQVIQTATFKNSGTEKENILTFNLPQGAREFKFLEEPDKQKVQVSSRGFVDMSGLEPGKEKKFAISYMMPIQTNLAQWTLQQPYLTEFFEVFIPTGVMSFEAAKLKTQSQIVEMNGQKLRQFTRLDIHPGEQWLVSFRVMDGPAGTTPQQQNGQADEKVTADGKRIIGHEHGAGYGKAAFTLGVIFIALAAAMVGLKRSWAEARTRETGVERTWLLSEKETLLRKIAQLEEDFTAQLISEETYFAAKEELRNKMIRLVLELRRGNAG